MVGITLKNLSKRFGEVTAVDGVSLDIGRGELFFLLGPSGCGKTTILRMIAGFETPDSGEILFDGRPISKVPAHKRNTALVFQNYALWPHMTVAENVAYGLRERSVPSVIRAERVMKALRSVRMAEYAGRNPNQLSGGQQQRVALARALVIEPDAVLLDEPLSNLDARLRLDMRREIRRIHDETGITMVYVTHDQKEALSMADKMAVMSMGRVEQVGDPRTIYCRPVNKFVAGFVGETNMIPGKATALEGGFYEISTALGRFRAKIGAARVAQGGDVTCMLRPESLRLGTAPAGNTFKGRLADRSYLGETEEIVVNVGALPVRALLANPGRSAMPVGQDVELCFDPEDVVTLGG